MTPTALQSRLPASSPAAHPCALDTIRRASQKTLENDTPDAIADCAAYRPQSQQRRGLAPTTPLREADHGQTTALATH